MSCTVGDVVELMERIAPVDTAEPGDNVGLLIGSPRSRVGSVLVALELNREVVEEARKAGAGMIVCHHPPIYRPLSRLREDDPQGSLLCHIVRSKLSVYAAHTNLDVSSHGVNVALAEALGLEGHAPLQAATFREGYKVVTFVPSEHLIRVSEALFRAGAGVIGDYLGCSFRTEGTGTFLPEAGAHPAYGEVGRMNEVPEFRLEVLAEKARLGRVLAALYAAHPYEEPAVDVYAVSTPIRGGMGRVGELPQPMSLEELAEHCRRRLGNPAVRFAGPAGLSVSKVAVCGGSGGSAARAAREAGAQALITGDVGHHQAQEAREMGLALVDAGHYHTERVVVPFLVRLLKAESIRRGVEVDFTASRKDTCPWESGGAD